MLLVVHLGTLIHFLDCNIQIVHCFLRCLLVYHWTQGCFSDLGNLYNAAAIGGNPMVVAHRKFILHGLDMAMKNTDNVKDTNSELSGNENKLKLPHPFELFKCFLLLSILQLLANCLTTVLASQMGSAFTTEVQGAFQKFLAMVMSSLGSSTTRLSHH
uniref:Hemoglobin beta embryonic-1.2 n=1 Tax=Myripristis murdjan TaxID=586833 RepID=A0A668ACU9_9TELE